MVEAMNELVQMTVTRSIVYRRDPKAPTTRYLVERGFIERVPVISIQPVRPDVNAPYRLTQRGVDEAKRYAEGNKTFIGEDQ